MPPTGNSNPEPTSPGVRGRWVSSCPATPATIVCTRKALATPIHTSNGRNRVANTNVATNVLSGNSTGKINTKAAAATAILNVMVGTERNTLPTVRHRSPDHPRPRPQAWSR